MRFNSLKFLKFFLKTSIFGIVLFWSGGIFANNSDYVISNYPESITVPGLIFDKPFKQQEFRILYHHRNDSPSLLSMVISIQNFSDKTEKIELKAGIGGSTKDVIFAGHIAARSYLAQYADKGKELTLPPKSTTYILSHDIKPTQTSSGIVHFLRKSKHDLLRVKMGVVDQLFPHLSAFRDISSSLDQYRVGHFKDSIRKKRVFFDFKNKIASFEIGGKPYFVDQQINYELIGNYGVLHAFELALFNSLNSVKKVHFYLAPKKKNAVDRAIFLIDNALVEVGVSYEKDDVVAMQKFYSVIVEPGSKKEISLLTIPQAGCYYPVDVIIRVEEDSL